MQGARDSTALPARRLRPLLLALMLLLGCRGAEEDPGPIEHRRLVADLIEIATPPNDWMPKPMSERLDVRTRVPEHGLLSVQGRIWPTERNTVGRTGEVRFLIEEGGGEVLLDRTLATDQPSERFEVEIPLQPFAGREIDLVLRLERADRELAYAEWQSAIVEQIVPVVRQRAEQGWNLLFVVVDTWRADHCSLYGYERPTTPHLDELARDALVFEDAISQCSWTAPAVASLLTGLYPTEHGVVHGEPLQPRQQTLMEHLQQAGLSTYALSTNPLIGPEDGYAQGVETFEYLPHLRADEVNQYFLHWLDDRRGWRWGAYLHYMDPHDPYDAPAPAGRAFTDPGYQGLFVQQGEALNDLFHTVNFGHPPAHAYDAEDLAYLEAAYDGEILFWDQQFGQLIAELRRRGELERTVVAITSDHGEEFAEHGMFKHGHQLYDESVRVPLVLYAPGRVEPGRRRAQVETRRLSRAVLQLLNLDRSAPRPDDLLRIGDGDAWPAFSHTMHQPAPDEARRPVVASVRESGWKLIRWFEETSEALYRLDVDPGETTDVAAQNPLMQERYHQLLVRWLGTSEPGEGSEDRAPLDPELVERLKALGYIQ